MMPQIGSLFKWENFPHPDDAKIKDRYFIYLGNTSRLTPPVMVYLCTTTTQLQYYEKDGIRSRNKYLRINAGEYGLPKDCVLDITKWTSDFAELDIVKSEACIQILCERLDGAFLRKVWDLIRADRSIAMIIKQDIAASLRRIEVGGIRL